MEYTTAVLRPRASRLHLAFALALTLSAALAFYLPALRATHGDWPAPLDDVFIHYDFARSTALGHPFEWIPGQGYSSGETSPLYSFVLALGYALGFHGLALGVWAAAVACASLVAMMRGLRTLLAPSPEWVAWAGAVVLVSVGVLDWTWFSGMESTLLGATLVYALVAAKRAREAPPTRRAFAQWAVGAWGIVLVLLRPEAAIVVFILGLVVARRAGSQSALAALARAAGPGALASCAVLFANQKLTGDAMSAGAMLKLLSANPHLSDIDRARELVINLVYLRWKVLETGLAPHAGLWPLLPSLAVAALVAKRTRGLGAACLASGVAWALVVSWNGAARFQNFRYYMPPLAMLLLASALGLSALARTRFGSVLGGVIVLLGITSAAPGIPAQIAFFRDACANVHDQQVEVGKRLARIMPEGASVLVGDAGAIAYVSGHHAIDALGLGGYRKMPFVRAAVEGEAATVELIERLAPQDRPTHLALYPTWFEGITGKFGQEVDRVSLAHNVICGGVTKGVYLADWSSLRSGDDDAPVPRGAFVDALDVGDVVSEREHAYVSAAPDGGWMLLDVRMDEDGRRLFDAGRIVPERQAERFRVLHGAGAPAVVRVRTDDEDSDVDLELARGDSVIARAALEPTREHDGHGAWTTRRAFVAGGIEEGDSIALTVRHGSFHDFHVWIARD